MSMNDYKIIAGSSNRQLAGEIASYLNTQLGRASIRTNQKGEVRVFTKYIYIYIYSLKLKYGRVCVGTMYI